ncbi:MAG: aminotransferase class V-fold PLP-dependent enzyme, partial [Planctomycetota bacterium]|nr:aminotransferase class V-fold PLP-dependent enzyme [Planctomycetota bacterium]
GADELAAGMEESFGVIVRAGLHCAPLMHRRLGTADGGGAVRVSPGPFNTEADMSAAVDAVRALTAPM